MEITGTFPDGNAYAEIDKTVHHGHHGHFHVILNIWKDSDAKTSGKTPFHRPVSFED